MGDASGSDNAFDNRIENVNFAGSGSKGDLLDFYQQLRHEATGLRLQLASKQEVLERSVVMIDKLTDELNESCTTISLQQDQINDLTRQLELLSHKKSQPATPVAVENTNCSQHGDNYDTTKSSIPSLDAEQSTPSKNNKTKSNNDSPTSETSPSIQHPTAHNNNNNTNRNATPHRTPDRTNDITPNDIREAVKNLALKDQQLLQLHEVKLKEIHGIGKERKAALTDFWAAKGALGRIPTPENNKSPELAPSCKITMAARSSNMPSHHQRNMSNNNKDKKEETGS